MTNATRVLENPFRPGAGHTPPYLAGRDLEIHEFGKLLKQHTILKNLIISGLRGIGKTVLLESLKPVARKTGWLWAGTDCAESVSISEETMAMRLLTDIALITSNVKVGSINKKSIGFSNEKKSSDVCLDYSYLSNYFNNVPGFISDKLKATLEMVWGHLASLQFIRGIVFAYDEAQTLSDHSEDRQYPLSLLLDVFTYIQKSNIPFMLVLTGLPMLLANLVETRTYSERLFHVVVLEKLTNEESKNAIVKPIETSQHPLKFNESAIDEIIQQSGGYPYFIQYICREVFDIFLQQADAEQELSIPMDAIIKKLDNDFFSGRWAKATERERDLLTLITNSEKAKFKVHEIVALSENSGMKRFGRSQVSQMFRRLITTGLLYKDNNGNYSFAVPLLEKYISRVQKEKN
ncbi:hypothetical protein COT50_01295 [candidate division WWE3 bacterium CG08_land_8_20_14_0_20_41_10]|uniref:Orc1-like AAA ATPase domain-containing protein n=1 Tax=candidate division WWE3 bacterium CG08_land_8_20_14_0_20_41_10 TaxID=1975085 RepID=A0A2H0XCB2_UNCKA|nr:MAG: hypothetical protein COT50_01295 [candidate division WWE3 bacterium CG08_land_8_20_14_0_20_41_10]